MKQGTHKPKPQQKEAQRGQHHNKHQNKPKAESKRPVFASQITPEQNQEQQEASNQLTNEHQDASHGSNTNYEKPYTVVGVNNGVRSAYQDPFYTNNPDYKKPYTVVGVNDGPRPVYQDPFYTNNPDYVKPYQVAGVNDGPRPVYSPARNLTESTTVDEISSKAVNSEVEKQDTKPQTQTSPDHKPNTENTQKFTQSLSQQTPINFIKDVQDTTAANTALQSEKTNLKHSLPQIEQPTGLNTQAKGTAKNVQNQAKTQQAKQKAKTALPNLSPTGKTQGTQIDTTVEQATGDTNLAVNTNLGNAPTVDLQGQANPQHNAAFQSESTQEVNKQLASTQAQSEVYTGENHIRPEVDKEILSPSITLAEIPTTASLTDDVPTLSSEVQHTFNTEAQASLDAQLQPEKTKQEAAYQQLLSDQEQEKTNTDAKITAETQAVKQQQQQAQNKAKQTVKGHKKAWKAEAKAVKDAFSSKSEAEKAKTDAIIETKITQADTKVEQTYDTAQKKAEAEVETSEQETQNQSWWDKAKSAISNFFDKLKTTVNSIIEKAKTLVNTIIDTARNAIVAAIKSFGTVLKTFVSIAFAAFPSISAKFNTLIDTAIHKAVTVVNTLAEGLKKTVNTLLDGLAKVLDGMLAIYQKGFSLFMAFANKIAKGFVAIIKRLNIFSPLLEMLSPLLGNVKALIKSIIKSPRNFFNNLFTGVGQGFQNFGTNLFSHLKTGLFGWLTGAMQGASITVPEAPFSLKGIFSISLQVLNLGWQGIRAIGTKVISEPVMKILESSFTMVQIVKNEGVAGLWQYLKGQFQDLKTTVLEAVMGIIQTKVLQAGIKWLLSLLSPVGAIIKVIMSVIEVVKFFVQRITQIAELVKSFVQAIAAIAAGKISGIAASIENALGKAVPVLIGLLASVLGIGGLANKVMGVIRKIRKRIVTAITKFWKFVKKKARKLLRKLGVGKKEKKSGEKKDHTYIEPETFTMSGKGHTLSFEDGEIYMASTKAKLSTKLGRAFTQVSRYPSSEQYKGKSELILHQLKRLKRVQANTEKDLVEAESSGDEKAIAKGQQKLEKLATIISKFGNTYGLTDIFESEDGEHKEFEPIKVKLKAVGQAKVQVSYYYSKKAHEYGQQDFDITIGLDTINERIITHTNTGKNLALKPVGSRGLTKPAGKLGKYNYGMKLNSAHIIGDQFLGSGYQEGLNLILTSDLFNKKIMWKAEEKIQDGILEVMKNNKDKFVTFDLYVHSVYEVLQADTFVEVLRQVHTGMTKAEEQQTLETLQKLKQLPRRCSKVEYAAKLKENGEPMKGLITAETKKEDIWLNKLFNKK